MPKSNAVWGIDIGNSALKAIRCRPGEQADEIVADAFDFIEYPKILTEPGAEPAELVADAVKQFLKRNTVKGDPVVMSVPGQTGLARFIKLPPVETKKIPAIVEYEAKQQIPFALEDVVWDYQQMPGSTVEEGFALEAEVGLFAMKREQVYRALEPLTKSGVEVEMVQLAPLALYNFLIFDQMTDLPPEDEFIADAPPPSAVILSMGTDATDLVITNGFRVWQRSIPIGGNHFTRALSKELKLTFAKAEHLKRNATAAEDPKAVFQAMRPVFSDLLTEVQRSIGYFTSIDRAASIDHVVGLGNAMKLPGLRKYLAQSLGYDVKHLPAFRGLKGDEVVAAPAFKENLLSFAAAYGLAVQGLGKAPIKTNLLPAEILKERMIRAKKPWAVAAVAVLLTALSVSFVGYTRALATVDEKRFERAEPALKDVVSLATRLKGEADTARADLETVKGIGDNVTSNVEGRILWLELLKAINSCVPSDPEGQQPEEIAERRQLYIVSLQAQKRPDLATWFTVVKERGWFLLQGEATKVKTAVAEAPEAEIPGPSGPGYLVQITGYHFRNWAKIEEGRDQGPQFVRDTLIANLFNNQLLLPARDERGRPLTDENGDPKMELVSVEELGISYPTLIDPQKVNVIEVQDPSVSGAMQMMPGASGMYRGEDEEYSGGSGYGRSRFGGSTSSRSNYGSSSEEYSGDSRSGFSAGATAGRVIVAPEEPEAPPIKLGRFDFVVQFCWQPTPPSVRQQKKAEAAAAAAAAAAGEATEAGAAPGAGEATAAPAAAAAGEPTETTGP
jgi:type IV pilus assembly protein PilM